MPGLVIGANTIYLQYVFRLPPTKLVVTMLMPPIVRESPCALTRELLLHPRNMPD